QQADALHDVLPFSPPEQRPGTARCGHAADEWWWRNTAGLRVCNLSNGLPHPCSASPDEYRRLLGVTPCRIQQGAGTCAAPIADAGAGIAVVHPRGTRVV